MKNLNLEEVIVKAKSKGELITELDQRISVELSKILKAAHPNRERIHQLAKLMHRELGDVNFETAKSLVIKYYSVPFERRTGPWFASVFGISAYPWLHSQFTLNFCTAHVSETKIAKFATSLRYYFTLSIDPPAPLGQVDFLHLTLFKLLHPRIEMKNAGLGLREFVSCWQKTAQSKWGDKYEHYFESLTTEAPNNIGLGTPTAVVTMGTDINESANELDLSQTDLDWMKSILVAIKSKSPPPLYPLARGPNRGPTRQLEKLVRAIKNTKKVELKPKLQSALVFTCAKYLRAYSQFTVL